MHYPFFMSLKKDFKENEYLWDGKKYTILS